MPEPLMHTSIPKMLYLPQSNLPPTSEVAVMVNSVPLTWVLITVVGDGPAFLVLLCLVV